MEYLYLFVEIWLQVEANHDDIYLIKRQIYVLETHKVEKLGHGFEKKPLKKSYEPNTFLAMASMHAPLS